MDKSLLRQDDGPGGEPRYRMLETVREFGLDELANQWRGGCYASAPRGVVPGFGRERQAGAGRPDQGRWLARLEIEHDNLRAALGWLRERGNVEAGLRLSTTLSPFWFRRGHLAEGRMHLREVLALPGAATFPDLQAEALTAVAVLAEAQSDKPAAQEAGEGALALWRALGDQRGAARALLRLAWMANRSSASTSSPPRAWLSIGRRATAGGWPWRWPTSRASPAIEATWGARDPCSMRAWRFPGNGRRRRRRLAARGPRHHCLVSRATTGEARALFEESLALFRAAGDRRGVTWATHSLGQVAWTEGELEQAAALHEEALTLARETGDRREVGLVLAGLGYVAVECGDVD